MFCGHLTIGADNNNSPQAQAARRIAGFHELDGIEFAARIDIEKDSRGEDRNTIKTAIEPDHKDYAAIMGVMPKGNPGGNSGAPAAVAAPSYTPPAAAARPTPSTVPGGKPAWAQ